MSGIGVEDMGARLRNIRLTISEGKRGKARMAFDVKKKNERLAELAVPFGDEKITLKYRADKITPNYLETQLSEVGFCADVIAEWDITDGGKPYPPTIEHLSEQGADLSYTLCYAIVNDVKTSAIQKLNR